MSEYYDDVYGYINEANDYVGDVPFDESMIAHPSVQRLGQEWATANDPRRSYIENVLRKWGFGIRVDEYGLHITEHQGSCFQTGANWKLDEWGRLLG